MISTYSAVFENNSYDEKKQTQASESWVCKVHISRLFKSVFSGYNTTCASIQSSIRLGFWRLQDGCYDLFQ